MAVSKPLAVLTAISVLGMTAVFAVPRRADILASAVKLDWPVQAGPWVKVRDGKPTAQEVSILAPDTTFSKAEYTRQGIRLHVDAGIVLAGLDPNNSIHRPERCLVAQGHSDLTRQLVTVTMTDGSTLPAMRLFTRIHRGVPRDNTPAGDSSQAQSLSALCVTYYFFVGHNMITASHYARTLKDMRDRLFDGANQRWAYVTLSCVALDTPAAREAIRPGSSDGEVDRVIQDFASHVIPNMIDANMVKTRDTTSF